MDKTVQYTIITNKEYSFPNCINKLCTSGEKTTTQQIDNEYGILNL